VLEVLGEGGGVGAVISGMFAALAATLFWPGLSASVYGLVWIVTSAGLLLFAAACERLADHLRSGR
jgi:hypothetical protein